MSLLKKIIIRLFALALILCGINLCYNRWLYADDVHRYADALDSLDRNLPGAEVLYFGESSNVTTAPADTCRKYISQLTADYFPGLKLHAVTKYAAHAGNYLQLIKNIPAGSKVKAVIVTMNLRSFSPGWINSELENQLSLGNLFATPHLPGSVKHFMGALRAYDYKTQVERDTLVFRDWHRNYVFPFATYFKSASDWDYCTYTQYNQKGFDSSPEKQNIRNVACHFIKNYAFRLDTAVNPRIRDFDEIVAQCRKRNIRLVFNLLPENEELGDTLVGKELISIMRYNRDLLVNRYTAKGVLIADNLEALPSSQYIDTCFTSEHYRELGRKIVAQNLALKLKEIFPTQYKAMSRPAHFYSDFESRSVYWPKGAWLTTTEYVSPQHANEISAGAIYSSTFVDFLYNWPDQPFTVKVKLKYKGPLARQVRLCVMKGLDSRIMFWSEFYFDEVSRKELANDWYEIEQAVTVPARKYYAEQLKVFITNISGKTVFMDDMEISYE